MKYAEFINCVLKMQVPYFSYFPSTFAYFNIISTRDSHTIEFCIFDFNKTDWKAHHFGP